jgi:hypothetical protein
MQNENYTRNYLIPWVRVLFEKLIVAQMLNLSVFMKPESSLPCSQETATGPYPEPDESNPNRSLLSCVTA